MSTTVIVGGGAAGLELVTRLARQRLGNKEHQVILVEPSSYHYWKPRLHEVAAGTFDSELDAVNYAQHAACSGYRYIQARTTGLERNSKTLLLHDAQGKVFDLGYDHLVIAVGATSNARQHPGGCRALPVYGFLISGTARVGTDQPTFTGRQPALHHHRGRRSHWRRACS